MDIFDYFNIRKRRDPHYEGKFYIGAYSMGIFCNVTCPIPPPEDHDEDDLVYLHNIYEGFECGLLPCEECEVDMYADQIVLNRPISPYVRKAVTMIENGYLDDHARMRMPFANYRYMQDAEASRWKNLYQVFDSVCLISSILTGSIGRSLALMMRHFESYIA